MHKIAFTVIIICILNTGINSENKKSYGQYSIQAEYRYDIIDYDDEEKSFFREKAKVQLSKDSSFNFAHVYVDKDDENRFTWNLALLDISSTAKIILGNYSVNFGSGLLIGKKKYITPDLFSSKLVVSSGRCFSPVNSGNPVFSFNGITLNYAKKLSKKVFSINLFYSTRERFINIDAYNNRYITSSINSVNNRIIKEYNYSEPAGINDGGVMAEYKYKNSFLIQSYLYHTDLKSSNGKNILWDYDDSQSSGIDNHYGYGFFSQYSDSYIVIFIEYARARADYYSDNNIKAIDDFGLLYGTRFKHPYFAVSITGKNTGDNYYPLYSSGHNYPERGWIFTVSIKPKKSITLGSNVSSYKKLEPGYSDNCLPVVSKELLFINWKFVKNSEFKIQAARLENNSDEYEKKFQYKSSLKIKPIKRLKLNISSILQNSNSQRSWTIGTGVEVLFLKYCKMILNYSRFSISEKNSIYATISPISNSINSGSFMRKTSHVAAAKLSIKYNKNIFSARYLHKFTSSESISKKIEILGRIYF